MAEKIVWLTLFASIYGISCLVCGYFGARANKRYDGHFVVSDGAPMWAHACALSASGLGAWIFIVHPGLIYRDGFAASALFHGAIALPLASLLLFGRLSALARRFDHVSVAGLLGEYFQSPLVRNLVVLVGLGFALPLLAAQLRGAGLLLNLLSDDAVSVGVAIPLLAAPIAIHVAWGGMRSAIAAGTMQYMLMVVGIVVLGSMAFHYVGGLAGLSDGMAALADIDGNRTADGFSHYLAVPGIMQFVASGREAVGTPWTGVMTVTTLLAFTGMAVSPVFAGWALCAREAHAAASGTILSSALVIGLALLVFGVAQGMGGHLLGGDMAMVEERGDFVYNIMGANLAGLDLMETRGRQEELVPILIHLLGDTMPWLFGIAAICALAALQATSAALLAGTGALLAQAFPGGRHRSVSARRIAAVTVFGLTAAALALARIHDGAVRELVHTALAIGAQMWPGLLAVCRFPRLTGRAIAAGLVAGMAAVFVTEPFGVAVLGIRAWGGWPLTVHSAFWGLLANVATALAVSAIDRDESAAAHRERHHRDRRAAPDRKVIGMRVPFGPASTCALWLLFGAGPGAVLGNTLFGSPNVPESWVFGIPSIWVWQGLWWALGVAMLHHVARALAPRTTHPTAP